MLEYISTSLNKMQAFFILGILLLKITQIKVIFMENRTDLALECFESAEKTKLDGVIVRENNAVTTVEVTNENGALALGKPKGKYVTLNVQSFVTDTNVFDERLNEFSSVLKTVLPKMPPPFLLSALETKISLLIPSGRKQTIMFWQRVTFCPICKNRLLPMICLMSPRLQRVCSAKRG